jgi:hypothetical protein
MSTYEKLKEQSRKSERVVEEYLKDLLEESDRSSK